MTGHWFRKLLGVSELGATTQQGWGQKGPAIELLAASVTLGTIARMIVTYCLLLVTI